MTFEGRAILAEAMRSWWLGISILAVLASPRLAHAASHYRFLYVREAGAEGCPGEMELRLSVVARLGYDPFSPNASGALFARIGQQDGRLAGSVELVDEQGMSRGKRQLAARGGNCDEVAHALALSISIAIDPERATASRAESSERSAPPAKLQEAQPTSLPAATDPEQDVWREHDVPPLVRDAGRGSVALSALTVVGVAPVAAFGAAGWYEQPVGPLVVKAGARFAIAPGGTVDEAVALRVRLVASDVGLCWQHSVLEACGVGLAGASWVSGGQLRSPRTSVGPFVALGARLALGAPVSRSLGFFAAGEALGIGMPVRAEVDGVGVWKAPSFAAGLLAGARLRFP